MENASLKNLLREHIELKGFTPKKISELTSIPERYIHALLEGNDAHLPPSPYVHGYITKLSAVLNFDQETMWRLYQKEAVLRSAGQYDRLPNNRFAIKSLERKWMVGGIIGIILLAYLGFNLYDILTPPRLAIIVPAEESITVNREVVIIKGAADPSYTLTINGSEVPIDKDGLFEKEYALQPGGNSIEFIAKKFLGKELRIIRTIVYAAPEPPIEINELQKPDDKTTNTESE